MSTVASGLADPPDDARGRARLARFPAAGPVDELHRLSEHPRPWFFSSVVHLEDRAGGRFDLTALDGTCYLAESIDGALVEKLLRHPTKVVVAERLDELFHLTALVTADIPTADLTARRATGHGINAEIHSTLDYSTPRRWAAALRRAGFRALRHRLRGDATGRLAGRALFGTAGLHRRAPRGCTTREVTPLDVDRAAAALADRGVLVLPIPSDVPVP